MNQKKNNGTHVTLVQYRKTRLAKQNVVALASEWHGM